MGRLANNTGRTIIVEINLVKLIVVDGGYIFIEGVQTIVITSYEMTPEERKGWWAIHMVQGGAIQRTISRIVIRMARLIDRG